MLFSLIYSMVLLVFLKKVFKFYIFILSFFVFSIRKLHIFLYFIIVDLRLGLHSLLAKPYPWCLYKIDEIFIFQILQFIWGVIIPILLSFWRLFLSARPLLVYLGRKTVKFFLFWLLFREEFYMYMRYVFQRNWYQSLWALLWFMLFVGIFCAVPTFLRCYEFSGTLSDIYDIEVETVADAILFVYVYFLTFYLGLTALIFFFFFVFFYFSPI